LGAGRPRRKLKADGRRVPYQKRGRGAWNHEALGHSFCRRLRRTARTSIASHAHAGKARLFLYRRTEIPRGKKVRRERCGGPTTFRTRSRKLPAAWKREAARGVGVAGMGPSGRDKPWRPREVRKRSSARSEMKVGRCHQRPRRGQLIRKKE